MVKFIEAYYTFLGHIDPILFFVLGCIVFGIGAYVAYQFLADEFEGPVPFFLSGLLGMLATLIGIILLLIFPVAICISIIVLTTIASAQFIHRLIKPKN